MSADGLDGWTPATKTVFSDDELIRHLRETLGDPSRRTGNWWAFFGALPEPERRRLEACAAQASRE